VPELAVDDASSIDLREDLGLLQLHWAPTDLVPYRRRRHPRGR
jgi:hypothetical protein